MSQRHPIIAITGSSGAGTTTVKDTFSKIFVREGVKVELNQRVLTRAPYSHVLLPWLPFCIAWLTLTRWRKAHIVLGVADGRGARLL